MPRGDPKPTYLRPGQSPGSLTPPERKQKTGAQNLESLEKITTAIALRKSGVAWRDIAKAIGWSDGSVAYNQVMRFMRRQVMENIEEMRQLELERLDEMQMTVYQAALGGDDKAFNKMMRIMDMRQKLMGLHPKEEVVVNNDVKVVYVNDWRGDTAKEENEILEKHQDEIMVLSHSDDETHELIEVTDDWKT